MTIVVAMKFGERICVMSDTMISDRDQARDNIIPGRLKSIVINEWLTVSYAGLSTQAIDAIRKISNSNMATTKSVVDYLLEVSARYPDELDFIVCSHEVKAKLIKISNGTLMEGAKAYWIGSAQAAAELSKVPVLVAEFEGLPEYMSADEVVFRNSFITYMREHRCEGIGGAVIDCLCSPYGHCYNTHAGAFSWDTILLGIDDNEERQKKNRGGMHHYEYHISSTSARGQGIVGFYLDQAKTGFIYDPTHYDEAMKIEATSLSDFSRLVEDAGQVLSRNLHNNRLHSDRFSAASRLQTGA
jgi:hypothetical protein